MALVHRALFTWFIGLIFLILLVLRLDARISWNWFFVFAPIWFYDLISILYYVFVVINHFQEGYFPEYTYVILKKCWLLSCVILKITFQVLICLYMEQQTQWLSLQYVFIPFWINAVFFSLEICVCLKLGPAG